MLKLLRVAREYTLALLRLLFLSKFVRLGDRGCKRGFPEFCWVDWIFKPIKRVMLRDFPGFNLGRGANDG
jgi:hypothetical protein